MKKLLILFSVLFITACGPNLNSQDISDIDLNPGFDIITVGDNHIDAGCIITVDDEQIEMDVISNTVNVDVVGEYSITYKYTGNEGSYECERIVKVIDDVSPVVSLNPGIDTVYVGELHIDTGIIYSDNYDEDLEVTVVNDVDINVVGRYVITYTVVDDFLNETIIERIVNVVNYE